MYLFYIIIFSFFALFAEAAQFAEIMSGVTVTRIPEIPNLQLGEGPHWDVETQSLFFVDIVGKSIHKYTPSTKEYFKVLFESPVSFIIPVKGEKNKYVISLEREIAVITWDGKSDKVSKIEKIGEVDKGTENRLNDGKCDPNGRLFLGTLGPNDENGQTRSESGNFFTLLEANKLNTLLTNVGISNGLVWNMALKKFYYIDSLSYSVAEFDYDINNGTISNRRTIFSLPKPKIAGLPLCVPDGMTIDKDGNLWVAVFGGSKVLKIDPKLPETVLESIEMPAKQITSVAWGGPNLDVLYVTSANLPNKDEKFLPPNHGAVFQITGLGTQGVPADNCKL